jgi:bacteriorhodopsin
VNRPRPWLAASTVAATALLLAIAVLAAFATPGGVSRDAWSGLGFIVPVAIFSVVGSVIARRRPENLVGWLLATIGLLFAIVVAASLASKWALKAEALPKPIAGWISVPASLWVPALGLIGRRCLCASRTGSCPRPAGAGSRGCRCA